MHPPIQLRSPRWGSRSLLALLLLEAGLCGCASDAGLRGASRAVEAYVAAIESDEPDRVHALLDPQLRQQVDATAFDQRWRHFRRELLSQARKSRSAGAQTIEITATETGESGQQRTLILQEGRWRVASGPLESADRSSPRQAVQALLAAIRARDFYRAIELLAPPLRERLQHDLEDHEARLQAALSHPAQLDGDRARIVIPNGQTIELVLEDGSWRVASLE